eukprot:3884636-Pleurochrysis_carterae.AAC.1
MELTSGSLHKTPWMSDEARAASDADGCASGRDDDDGLGVLSTGVAGGEAPIWERTVCTARCCGESCSSARIVKASFGMPPCSTSACAVRAPSGSAAKRRVAAAHSGGADAAYLAESSSEKP